MAFKRRAEPTTIEDERAALRAQHAALEDLKRQLNERVEAVRERELELHHALLEANSAPRADAVARPLPPPLDPPVATTPVLPPASEPEADTGEDAQALAERERAAAETMVGVPVPVAEPAAAPDAEALAPAAAEAEARAEVERLAQEKRLAQIETRLAELREAEKMFLRTRDELAARSEAVAARERLVSQKERELDDREDGVGQWASPELTEMEARLRRLEQQQDPSEQTMGFSGGLRKLQQGTTRPQRAD